MTRTEAVDLILSRCKDNDIKWGREGSDWTSDSHTKMTILTEEVGEIARAILEGDKDNLKQELMDVAAVCVAWLQSDFAVAERTTHFYTPSPGGGCALCPKK